MAEPTGQAGRVAIITGAGRRRSIGRSIAISLARVGCDIVITGTGRRPESYTEDEKEVGWRDIDSVAEEVSALGRRALALVSDVRDASAVDALMARTIAEFGHIDILVNNASAARGKDRVPIVELDEDVWRMVLEINLNGTFLMSRAVARRMIEQGTGGRIVNISSIAGKQHGHSTGAYSASKSAVQSLTCTMALELGPHQITVNSVLPGVIDTARYDDFGRGETWNEMIKSRIPIGRAGTGEDIANMVTFLCSAQSDYITGQNYVVDCGIVRH